MKLAFPNFVGSIFNVVLLLPPSESDVVVLRPLRKQQHPCKATMAEETRGRAATAAEEEEKVVEAAVKQMRREDGSVLVYQRINNFFQFPLKKIHFFNSIYTRGILIF